MGTGDTNQEKLPWEAELMRLTAFSVAQPVEVPSKWWSELTGAKPESETTRPRDGTYRAEGPFEAGTLTLLTTPGRVDWLYTKRTDEPEDKFTTLGSYWEHQGAYRKLMTEWLGRCPAIMRLAFGTVLLLPVNDRKEGYSTLSSLLPAVGVDAEHSSDFMYQINRSRSSNVMSNDFELNRLSKWSVVRRSLMRLEMHAQPSSMHPMPVPESDASACRLELDINTSPGQIDELPAAKLRDLFGELVELANEIASRGDVP
jgi:hypothetical protein